MLFNTHKQILLDLLAGTGVKPNYLYLEYTNAASAPSGAPSASDTDHFAELGTTENFLRVPITITPTVADDTVTYSVFFANTADGVLDGHAEFGASSSIYAIALVAGESEADSTKDALFAYHAVSPVLEVSSNSQLAVQFKLTM